MKLLLPCFAAFAMIALFPLTAAHAQDSNTADKQTGAYTYKNRVLFVFAPTEQNADYREQTKLWQGEKAGFEERQLLVTPVLADGSRGPGWKLPGPLAKSYSVDPKTFTVILIGKDGHEAYRSVKPVPAATLYAAIDAMPMRRAEMKRQSPTVYPSPTPRPTPSKPDLDHDE